MKRACQGKTRKDTACKAAPLSDSDYCLAHSDAITRESAGFIAKNGKAGRKKLPREVDVIREGIEAKSGLIYRMLEDAALNAERAVVVGNGPTAHVVMVPDVPTRIQAGKELLDRSYGRPHQSSDVTVITQDSIERAMEQMEGELASNDPDRSEHRSSSVEAVSGAQG